MGGGKIMLFGGGGGFWLLLVKFGILCLLASPAPSVYAIFLTEILKLCIDLILFLCNQFHLKLN